MKQTDEQQQIRNHPSLSLLLTAPAGCGKTEALAIRIAGLIERGEVEPPRRVLAVTFSNRAKDNLRARLRDHVSAGVLRERVTVNNFHGLASRIIRAHAAVIGVDPAILMPDGDWVREQCQNRGLNYDNRDLVAGALRDVKQQPLNDDEVSAALLAGSHNVALDIERQRVAENRATYDDLLRLGELIVRHDGVAGLYRNHFAAVVVDEYQDLTTQQLRFLTRIGEDRITFAGDVAQGIYAFTGARPLEIDAAVRAACAEMISFNKSHRSSPAVLSMVNALNTVTGGTDLECADPASWPGGGLAGCFSFADEAHEGRWLSGMCKYVTEAAPTHRIGIIARVKTRLAFVDGALTAAGIDVHRWEDGVLDTDTAGIVRSMLARLDTTSLALEADPLQYLRSLAEDDALEEPDTRRALVDALSWVLDRVVEGDTPADIGKRIRVGGQNTLVDAAGVHLLSGHVGKGQQFDWVIVVGADDDTLPFFKATTPEAVLEEARVLSVMVSRARHGVLVTYARSSPTAAGSVRSRNASRFLPILGAADPLGMKAASAWMRSASWPDLVTR